MKTKYPRLVTIVSLVLVLLLMATLFWFAITCPDYLLVQRYHGQPAIWILAVGILFLVGLAIWGIIEEWRQTKRS